MSNPRGYYERLHALLELAGAAKASSLAELTDKIFKESPPNFVYRRWEELEKRYVDMCSRPSIERTAGLGVELGFLNEASGRLTRGGKVAADPAKYDATLAKALEEHLEGLDSSTQAIARECERLLQKGGAELPTSDILYGKVVLERGVDLTPARFRRLLNLLSSCGAIGVNKRHVYLPNRRRR